MEETKKVQIGQNAESQTSRFSETFPVFIDLSGIITTEKFINVPEGETYKFRP